MVVVFCYTLVARLQFVYCLLTFFVTLVRDRVHITSAAEGGGGSGITLPIFPFGAPTKFVLFPKNNVAIFLAPPNRPLKGFWRPMELFVQPNNIFTSTER